MQVLLITVDNLIFLYFPLDAKCQVLANLANFSYDPINYPHLQKLNVAELFLGMLIKKLSFFYVYMCVFVYNIAL